MPRPFSLAVCMLLASSFPALSDTVFEDSFEYSSGQIDKKVWNTGGACRINGSEAMVITTFTSEFGAIGDGTGAAGLSSPVGAATFTVAVDGKNPLGGNFVVGHEKFNDTSEALVRVDLAAGGAGSYEIFWNNTGEPVPYVTADGETGTLEPHTSLWSVDAGKTTQGKTTAAPGVDAGDPATTFGFWIANKVNPDKGGSEDNRLNAVIDDFRISSTPALSDAAEAIEEPG